MSPTSPRGSISAKGVWKRFRADQTVPALAAELGRARAWVRGRSDEYWRWVLRDVSFELRPGEALGLIGTNGSGKSTLLKLLTRVMYPYAGEVGVSGRVGALIEVDAGLHPELTGRENIYLYGSLSGLSDADIRQKFDSIVAFSGLESAIDRQVKHYSTGMRMRLGFTIVASSEPDILLIDEVLAVGDAAFQAKSLARIRNSLASGTTVVLVSHELLAVEAVCERAIWLDDGVVMADGPTQATLSAYRLAVERKAEADARGGTVSLKNISITHPGGGAPTTQGPMDINLTFASGRPQQARVYLGVSQGTALPIFTLRSKLEMPAGEAEMTCHIDRLPLATGEYSLWIDVLQDDATLLMEWQPVSTFHITGPELHGAPAGVMRLAPIHVESDWES